MVMKSSLRLLSVAALTGLTALGFGANKAQANEVPITPTLGDDASYTLTEVSTPTDNSITLYKYDNTGITEAINYEVNLKTTEYGEGDTSKYYDYVESEHKAFVSTNLYVYHNVKSYISSSEDSSNITVKYNSTNPQNLFTNTELNSDLDFNGNFIGNTTSVLPVFNNSGILGNISGSIVQNTNISGLTSSIPNNDIFIPTTNTYAAYGGAIYNKGEINSIDATFLENTITYGNNRYASVQGGAIYNTGTINNLSSDFILNSISNSDDIISGGAISNDLGVIKNITGNFIGNYIKSQYGAQGGAISNTGTIDNISGLLASNYILLLNNNSYPEQIRAGGAIYNDVSGKIGNIRADFIENAIYSVGNDSNGGAISNYGFVDNIYGDFISNNIVSMSQSLGGALYNSGQILSIKGVFINNSLSCPDDSTYLGALRAGGAIYNSGNISLGIESDFIGNFVYSWAAKGQGGAIFNDSTGEIISIVGDFVDNRVVCIDLNSSEVFGGAIANKLGTIGNITGDFVNNYAYSEGSGVLGGAIYNSGTIGDITGDFIGNYIESEDDMPSRGGAISNYYEPNSMIDVQFGNVTADFINNSVRSTRGNVLGGAIYNDRAKMGNIIGSFVNNYAESSGSEASGGAIYNNDSDIISLNGGFSNNYVKARNASGGAIYNYYGSGLGNIEGSILQNRAIATNGDARGGAIHNDTARIEKITGVFVDNYTLATNEASGGAIYNYRGNPVHGIGDISADFLNNYASGDLAKGGAIHSHLSSLGDISGKFVGNYAKAIAGVAQGGAIYNNMATTNWGYDCRIGEITADFIGNYAKSESGSAYGGAIYNYFSKEENSSSSVPSDTLQYMVAQILNDDGSVYKEFFLVVDSNGNTLTEEQIILLVADGSVKNAELMGTEQLSKTEFDTMLEQEGMTEDQFYFMLEQEGAIYSDPSGILANASTGVIKEKRLSSNYVRAFESNLTLKNSNFVSNYVESLSGEAKGGAIYAESSILKIEANNGEATLISGNYTKQGEEIDDNAIYMNGGKLIFDVTNGSTIQLDDNINGENGYETYVIGDSSSRFILNNKIKNSTTHLVDTNLYVANESNLDGNKLSLHSGQLSMINNQVGLSSLDRLVVTGDTNVNVDVDLKNQTMDRFTASEYGSHSGNLNVTGMNLLSDAVNDTTEILFAEQGLKDNVTNGIVGELPNNKYQTVAYTPVYKYNVSYDNREDAGYFVFTRPTTGGSSGGAPSVDTFNPAVLGSSTSATVGAVGTINQTLNHVFNNADTYMNIPYLERISMRDRNKYALSITGDATDMGRFSPLYQPSQEGSSVWVKPYATFETVGLKNGPKVHNNTYGTLVGFDSEMQHLKRGWDRVWTGYIGYNGASQRYSGIDSTQNGGLLGGTMTLYKGNFFNATTVSVGASVANNQTMYGNEDFAMLLSGIGNKTGYNFEFKEGKLILQPSMLMSYTFVNTFDYTNAAGVRIDNKPLHALQLAPGVKVIGNLKNGWQPYASVSMVWNLMGESNATANGVKLPEMSIKPYVQYGVGVQKRIKDHFTAYGQAMIQNGGRNGVSLTAGFRWALGHDDCKYKDQKVERVNDNSKKLSLGEGVNSSKKILKQMSPEQRMALGGKYHNTSRTAKTGTLRQY